MWHIVPVIISLHCVEWTGLRSRSLTVHVWVYLLQYVYRYVCMAVYVYVIIWCVFFLLNKLGLGVELCCVSLFSLSPPPHFLVMKWGVGHLNHFTPHRNKLGGLVRRIWVGIPMSICRKSICVCVCFSICSGYLLNHWAMCVQSNCVDVHYELKGLVNQGQGHSKSLTK